MVLRKDPRCNLHRWRVANNSGCCKRLRMSLWIYPILVGPRRSCWGRWEPRILKLYFEFQTFQWTLRRASASSPNTNLISCKDHSVGCFGCSWSHHHWRTRDLSSLSKIWRIQRIARKSYSLAPSPQWTASMPHLSRYTCTDSRHLHLYLQS